uniref:Uncharacterized protein n=1 Tax=Picea glauca TaxID=3330 RepID=A0A101LUD6_PICGL|nr:hypothetical protein ABT39_MTgene2629 [Picea glauca]
MDSYLQAVPSVPWLENKHLNQFLLTAFINQFL